METYTDIHTEATSTLLINELRAMRASIDNLTHALLAQQSQASRATEQRCPTHSQTDNGGETTARWDLREMAGYAEQTLAAALQDAGAAVHRNGRLGLDGRTFVAAITVDGVTPVIVDVKLRVHRSKTKARRDSFRKKGYHFIAAPAPAILNPSELEKIVAEIIAASNTKIGR